MNWLTRYAAQGEWLRRRAENVLATSAPPDVRGLHAADRLPLCAQLADRLDQRNQRRALDLDRAVRRRLRGTRERGNPLRPVLGRRRRQGAADHDADHGRGADFDVRALAAGRYRLCDVHEGREDRLSQDPLRLALCDLCRLRDRDDRPLLWLGIQAIRGKAPEAYDPTKAGSGV